MMDKQHSNSLRSSFLGSTPHPTSPITAAVTSTSPRLAHFSRRFRSPPPTAASRIVASLDSAPVQSRNAEAVKSAKRYLLSRIRNDWEYDPEHPPKEPQVDSPVPLGDVKYTRREDGSSDPGSGPEDHRDPMAWTDGETDPYKYESPDAIAAAISQKKRKRRKLLTEEIQFNEGLRIFIERRNAWTCAVRRRPKRHADNDSRPLSKADHSRNGSLNMQFDFELDRGRGPSPMPLSRPASRSSTANLDDDNMETTDAEAEQQPPSCPPSAKAIDIDPLLPIAPPLLPDENPVRAAITPSMYPTIYSKVVVQSLTPSVPIPLPDITRAMVQGWREEGNWPPRSTAGNTATIESRNGGMLRAEAAAAHAKDARAERREHLSMRKGMSGAFRKALGLKLSGHHHNNNNNNNTHVGNHDAGSGLGNGGDSPSRGGSEGDGNPMVNVEDADAMFEED